MSKPTENINKPSASAENNRYFNEYANGIGYLNSIREFGAKGKPERYAAQVSVIQGSADNVHYMSITISLSRLKPCSVLFLNIRRPSKLKRPMC